MVLLTVQILFRTEDSSCDTTEQVVVFSALEFWETDWWKFMGAELPRTSCPRVNIPTPAIYVLLDCRLHGAWVYKLESLIRAMLRARGDSHIGRSREQMDVERHEQYFWLRECNLCQMWQFLVEAILYDVISFWNGHPTSFLDKICVESKTGTVPLGWNHMSAPEIDGIEDSCVEKEIWL
jgi:hypothetical protein